MNGVTLKHTLGTYILNLRLKMRYVASNIVQFIHTILLKKSSTVQSSIYKL